MKKLILSSILTLSFLWSFAQQQFDYQAHSTTGSDTYMVNITNVTAYSAGTPERGIGFSIIFDTPSSGAWTLNVNGLGPIPGNGVILADSVYRLEYNVVTDRFVMISGGGGSGSSGPHNQLPPNVKTSSFTLSAADTSTMIVLDNVADLVIDLDDFSAIDRGLQFAFYRKSGTDTVYFDANGETLEYTTLGVSEGAFAYLYYNPDDNEFYLSGGGGSGSGGNITGTGTADQIAVWDGTSSQTGYSDFTWNNTNKIFIAGNGSIAGGGYNFNFGNSTSIGSGSWNFTTAEESLIANTGNNTFSSGWHNTIGDGSNAFSGSQSITIGTDNLNYGFYTNLSGIGGRINWVNSNQAGGFVHSFSDPEDTQGRRDTGIPYVTANAGAFNISRNTSSQTDGNGALARDGGILGGVDNHIPSTSPRSVIIGGSGIEGRASDPDNVYVPYLNIMEATQNDTLSQILARDITTKEVFWRDASTLAGGSDFIPLTGSASLTGALTLTGSSSNTLKFSYPNLGTTQTDGAGIWLQNSQAATLGSQQISPSLVLEGNGFETTGSTSQSAKFKIDVVPVQGTTLTSDLYFRSSINGAANTTIARLSSQGALLFPSGAAAVGTSGSSNFVLRTNNQDRVTISSSGSITIAQGSGGGPTNFLLRATAATASAQAASTENNAVRFNLSRTLTFATGDITTQREFLIDAPTYAFSGASVVTKASTFSITGSPIAGTNATITNGYALDVNSGNSYFGGKHVFDATITPGGTTGNQTINKPTGTVNIAAAGTTVTVTNSFCTTSSNVWAVIRTNDTTAYIKNVVPGAGSFVINLGAAATSEISIGFKVDN